MMAPEPAPVLRGGDTDLRGEVALVTGAGRGIGRSVALRLAAHGTVVVLVARSADELEETAALVQDAGGTARVLAADLAGPDGVAEVSARAAELSGPVGVLVNNAATVDPLGPLTEHSWASTRRAFDLNVVSLIALTGALLPAMLSRGWGRVVNVSSGVVARPQSMAGGNVYTATKAAVEAHTLNLAAELEGTGVTANVYRPGTVDTAMQAHLRDQDPRRVGTALVDRFRALHDDGALVSSLASAAQLVDHLSGSDNGSVWTYGEPSAP